MDLDMKLKFNFNKRNKYKNICSITVVLKVIKELKLAGYGNGEDI